jgi:hypothetical protein
VLLIRSRQVAERWRVTVPIGDGGFQPSHPPLHLNVTFDDVHASDRSGTTMCAIHIYV